MSFLEREEMRAQLRIAGAFLLGALLIALPLYLWRRPRTAAAKNEVSTIADAGTIDAGAALIDASTADAAAAPPSVTVGAARVLECHDQGSARTAPSECDHPTTIENAIANAITATAACAHGETGTIGYEIDVSFLRKRNPLEITVPHEDRTLKNGKTARACALEVKRAAIAAIDPDGGVARVVMASAPHTHGRYRLLVTATY